MTGRARAIEIGQDCHLIPENAIFQCESLVDNFLRLLSHITLDYGGSAKSISLTEPFVRLEYLIDIL